MLSELVEKLGLRNSLFEKDRKAEQSFALAPAEVLRYSLFPVLRGSEQTIWRSAAEHGLWGRRRIGRHDLGLG